MYPKSIKTTLLVAATLALGLTASIAGEIKAGDLIIENPVARETAPGAPVAGGFLIIKNTGTSPDRLTGGSAAFAGEVQVHQMKMENQVMKMSEVDGGLEIAPGESVTLKPGGYHLMFMKLGGQLKPGEHHKVLLNFEHAGPVEVDFEVLSMADTMKLKHSH